MIKIRRCQTRKARAGADIKLNDTSHLRCSKEVSPLTSGTPACIAVYTQYAHYYAGWGTGKELGGKSGLKLPISPRVSPIPSVARHPS